MRSLHLVTRCLLVLAIPPVRRVAAAESGDPKEIPVPAIATPMGVLPGPSSLPAQTGLPDVLRRADGSRVNSAADWPARRSEILRTLEYYAVGQAPPPPGNVKGRVVKTQDLAGESSVTGSSTSPLVRRRSWPWTSASSRPRVRGRFPP